MNPSQLKAAGLVAAALAGALPGRAQQVTNAHASVVDVASCQAALKATTDPVLIEAKKGLPSCAKLAFVPAPIGRMIIPRHYLSGSSGPVNPDEAAATRIYGAFERRITAGAAQYLATGSHAESAAALDQLDAWAKAGALLDYSREESSQAWYQAEWTLSSAGVTDSVLVNDSTLDPVEQRRVTAWLVAACRKDLSFEKPGDTQNNHYYWRSLAAVAIGITASDDELFRHGVEVYRQAIGELDANGALPKEMARHENAIHYQAFALEPLVTIAEFATRQGYDLYGYSAHGRTLRDAIVFFGRAVDDPGLVKAYTSDTQSTNFSPGDFAEIAFYAARFGTDGLPPSVRAALRHPLETSRIGYTTLLTAR
jgi:poly(beta-D-mannuronate) lyase